MPQDGLGLAAVEQADGAAREDAAITLQIGRPSRVRHLVRHDLGDVDRGGIERFDEKGGTTGELLLVLFLDLRVHLGDARLDRSEEHTSELQSLMRISYAAFCLKKT